MIEFLKRLFGQPGSSGSTAKERLRLVLMTDHLELAPDMIDAMKRDLVDVISRYVEVDRDKIEVSFEQQDKALAMLANIPILSVNRAVNGHATSSDAGAQTVLPQTAPAEAPAAAPAGEPAKRRRRRKKSKSAAATPESSAAATPETAAAP